MKLHFDIIQDLIGFAAENSKVGNTTVKVKTPAPATTMAQNSG